MSGPEEATPSGNRDDNQQASGETRQDGGHVPQDSVQEHGPGLAAIFSHPATKREIMVGVGLFAAIGVGLGVGSIGLSAIGSSGASSLWDIFVFLTTVGSPFVLATVIAAFVGFRQGGELTDEPRNLLLATAGATGLLGTFVMFVIGLVFTILLTSGGSGGSSGGGDAASFIGPLLFVCIGAAVTAVASAWLRRNVADTSE